MKYLELDLRAFGPFTDRVLKLDAGQHGLHLIYGPNEAGKSSLRRALRQMLFGIDEKTPDDFRHEYKALRLGGTLAGADGSTLAFLRRKGRSKVLKTPDEAKELDDNALLRFLGGFDARQFETLFSLDHDALVEGGRKVSEGQGDLGELLFGAGTDLTRLVVLSKRLESDAAALFKARGEVPPLNRKLKELEEARREIEAVSLRSDAWHEATATQRQAEQTRRRLDGERQALLAQVARLNRFEQALPLLGRRTELLSLLRNLAHTPQLPPDFTPRRRQAETDRHATQLQAERIADNLAEIKQALEGLEPPGPILDVGATVTDLTSRMLAHNRQAAEIERTRAELATLQRDNRNALLDLGRVEHPETMADLRSAVQQRGRVQQFAMDHNQLELEASAARASVHKLQQNLTRTTHALEQAEKPSAVEPLRRDLKLAQNAGNLPERQAEAQRKADQLTRKCQQAIAAFRIRPADGRSLLGLALPSPEQIEEFQARLDAADRAVADRQAAVEQTQQKRDAEALALEQHRLGRPVPSEADLIRARAEREQVWQAIRQRWLHAGEGDQGRQSAIPEELAAAHERLQQQADGLADLLRHEVDRVNKLASLTLSLQHAAEAHQTAETRLAQALAEQAAQRAAWSDLWAPLAIEPASPRTMRGWLNDLGLLMQCAREAELAQQQVEIQQQQLGELERRLSARLAELDLPLQGDETLVELIDWADQEVSHADEVVRYRRQLETTQTTLTSELDQAQLTLAEVQRRLEFWAAGWAKLVSPLGLEPDVAPEAVLTRLAQVEALIERWTRAEQAAARIHHWDDEHRKLESEARSLALRVLPEAADRPVADLIPGLEGALQIALDARTRREEREQARARAMTEAQEAAAALADAEARLAVLMRQAGVAKPEDLPAIEEQAQQRSAAEVERDEVERRLRGLSAGMAIDAFAAEALALEADALPLERARLEQQIGELDTAFDRLGQEVGAARQRLLQMEETAREAKAIEAALRTQDLLTHIESDASRFVRLKLARAVLQQAIERYRERSQGPMLKRASGHFARLTTGSFQGLDPEADGEGKVRLFGVRADGQHVPVSGLSEGTCDQLYLALKLAGIEHHLDHHEPMPFLADDILVNFDDGRSAAALEVLAELSKRTQVVFLTHHQHLVELARQTLPAGVLFTHDLSRAG